MRIIARSTLETFWMRHAEAKEPLKTWYADVTRAQWFCAQDIKNDYASASFVADNRVVFNIKGNKYRLVVAVSYKIQAVYIKFIGTHAQYNRIDVATVEHLS